MTIKGERVSRRAKLNRIDRFTLRIHRCKITLHELKHTYISRKTYTMGGYIHGMVYACNDIRVRREYASKNKYDVSAQKL